MVPKYAEGWWEDAFRLQPTASEIRGHKCGEKQMLTIVAYDITDPKRLKRIAQLCEDYGVRVEYSVFECRLDAALFEEFWGQLQARIDPETDRIVAYTVCARCAKEIRNGGTFVGTEKVICYVF